LCPLSRHGPHLAVSALAAYGTAANPMFSIVCISHTDGSGGHMVGRIVADRLKFRYVDEELILEAARIAQVDPAIIAATEQKQSLRTRFFDALTSAQRTLHIGSFGASATKDHAREELRQTIRAAIDEVARAGNAVIVAHAASMALAGKPGVLRVLVTAPNRIRSKRVAQERKVPVTEAHDLLETGDKARREYLRSFYEIDEELPTHYDLVVNTEVLTPERAAEVVLFTGAAAPQEEKSLWSSIRRRIGA
jgi:cytidylate kinase